MDGSALQTAFEIERSEEDKNGINRIVLLFIGTSLLGIVTLAVLGLVMRTNQSGWISIPNYLFYRIMSLHGLGMVAAAHMLAMSALWYFLARVIPVSVRLMRWNYWLCVVALVGMTVSILIGGFAGGLTFHYPLPFYPAGQWEEWSVTLFFISLGILGIPFTLYFINIITASVKHYGSVTRAMGWPVLFSRFSKDVNAPYVPPIVIGAMITSFIGILALMAGNVLVMTYLVRVMVPDLSLDALAVKNLLFFWAHNLTNTTLFISVNVIFGIVPYIAKRPVKTVWLVPFGWHLTLLFSIPAYAHHILMDVPLKIAVISSIFAQVMTYIGLIPAYVLTIFSVCMVLYRAGVKVTPAFAFVLTGLLGWGLGCFGGLIDATITVNFFLHNTQWVPGHFHTYYFFGVIFINIGFIYYWIEEKASQQEPAGLFAYWTMLIGTIGFIAMFFVSGLEGIPRRFAVTPSWGVDYSKVATIFASIIIIGLLTVIWDFWRSFRPTFQRHGSKLPA